MGLFSSKSSLVKVWQKIKDDAEKARGGGKKPGGAMGFETLIKLLETEMKAKTPDVPKIKTASKALRDALLKYKADLDPKTEKVFITGITNFLKVLVEMEMGAEDALAKGAGDPKLIAALTHFARVNAVFKGFTAELDQALTDMSELTKGQMKVGKDELKPVAATFARAKKAMDGLIKAKSEYEKAFDKLMNGG